MYCGLLLVSVDTHNVHIIVYQQQWLALIGRMGLYHSESKMTGLTGKFSIHFTFTIPLKRSASISVELENRVLKVSLVQTLSRQKTHMCCQPES